MCSRLEFEPRHCSAASCVGRGCVSASCHNNFHQRGLVSHPIYRQEVGNWPKVTGRVAEAASTGPSSLPCLQTGSENQRETWSSPAAAEKPWPPAPALRSVRPSVHLPFPTCEGRGHCCGHAAGHKALPRGSRLHREISSIRQ